MIRPASLLSALLTLSVSILPVTADEAEPTLLVHAGTLLAVPGEAPLTERTVVVEKGSIEAVLDGFRSAEEAGVEGPVEVIDLSDRFVVPGLIDLHTHITSELGPRSKIEAVTLNPVDHALNGVVHLRRTLDAGFTTIRNTGGDPEVVFALRRGVEAGKIAGPRLFAAGAGVAGTGGHADMHGYLEEILELFASSGICDGADDCRRAVRAQVKRGADWIKITATGGVLSETAAGVGKQLFDDELEAIVATATMLGRRVAAHAHGTDGINAALEAGVTTIEHGTYADETSFELFRTRGAYLVPTILAGETVAAVARQSDFMPAPIRDKAIEVGPQMLSMVGRAHRSGVRIAFGTDSGVSPHGQNGREFVLLVKAGLTPMEAIVSATRTAAEVLGLEDVLGTIEVGKRADLVATAGDPLEDVSALLKIDFVMKDGRVYRQNGAVVGAPQS